MIFIINIYFKQVESDDLTSTTPMIATMLDPRCKPLRFLSPARRISAPSALLELTVAEHVSSRTTEEATTRDEGGTDVPVQGTALQRHTFNTYAITLLLGENYTTSSNKDIEKVDIFLKDPPPLLDSSHIEWWKVNEGRFLRLANLAR